MPDNDWHRTVVHGQWAMLSKHYADDPNAYFGIDLLLLNDSEDKDREVGAPDVFVVFRVPAKVRDSYKVVVEGKAPISTPQLRFPSGLAGFPLWLICLRNSGSR